MGSRYATDDNDYPKPWEGDERLKDITLLAEINRVVKLVIKLAEAMEKVPVGAVPKAETIPKLWESVKDLKKENIAKITAATLDLGACTAQAKEETDFLFNKERRAREAVSRERENDKASRDKRSADEIQDENFEEAGSSSKSRKKDDISRRFEEIDSASKAYKIKENIIRHPSSNVEGTCANLLLSLHYKVFDRACTNSLCMLPSPLVTFK